MATLNLDRWREISPFLDHALSLPENERAEWLVSFHRERPDLADLVENLLEEHRVAAEEHFLEQEPLRPNDSGLSGETFGAYRLISRIGEGGMGNVWLAQRVDGRFERKVAIKFLNFALPSRRLAERFEREGRILGQLVHPHIAELLDAGVTAKGEPYLVLEYVEGKQIDEYCDEHTLSVEARIALFLDVLDAVAQAHSRLVVHRDIKPSNVLVSSRGEVKLLDFGIAKLLVDDTNSATMLTHEGGAMTPLFAAPEQVKGGAITTATDVYALGALLFVLLTGQHPIGPDPHSPADLMKAITETEPPWLSEVPGIQGEAAARKRDSSPEKLQRTLRGDLELIVAKALKKDAAERYGSVVAFGDDLRLYLSHRPISARPDSVSYQLRKYVRRHRLGVALAAGLALLLAGFSIIQTLELRRITRERDRADRIADFMTDMFKVSDPNEHAGLAVTAREVLDKAAADIRSNLSNDPKLQAQMLHVMGRAYLNLGLFSQAELLFKEGIQASAAVGDQNSRDTLSMTHDLAWAVLQQGRVEEAENTERKLLETQRHLLGTEHSDTLATMEELAFTLCNEGKGRCTEGIELTRLVLQQHERTLGPDAFYTLATMDNLAIMLAADGRLKEAIEMQEESLKRHTRKFGSDNIGTVNAMLDLGEMQREAGQEDEAEATLQELLTIENRAFAPEQGETAATQYDLASVLLRKGQTDQALQLLQKALSGNLAPRIAQGLPADPLFSSLHHDPRFEKLVDSVQKRFPVQSLAKTN